MEAELSGKDSNTLIFAVIQPECEPKQIYKITNEGV